MKRTLLGLVLLAGCDAFTANTALIVYKRDPRTGLCFAMTPSAYGAGLSEVPCDKVHHLIKESE